eukprot:m.173190 g.173190  ORF g.173190 m.173190 type:complete len:78 (+) comp17312_c0_seq2:2803-3036(+)
MWGTKKKNCADPRCAADGPLTLATAPQQQVEQWDVLVLVLCWWQQQQSKQQQHLLADPALLAKPNGRAERVTEKGKK